MSDETTPVLHRVFDVTTLLFGVNPLPLGVLASASAPGASIEDPPRCNPPLLPHGLSPTECRRSEEAPSSIRSSGGVVPSSCEGSLNEIEVTPEMIEAGLDELAVHDERFEPPEEAVARIFRAMVNLERSALAADKLGRYESSRDG